MATLEIDDPILDTLLRAATLLDSVGLIEDRFGVSGVKSIRLSTCLLVLALTLGTAVDGTDLVILKTASLTSEPFELAPCFIAMAGGFLGEVS